MIRYLLVLICIKYGYGYPEGAPTEICDTMMPNHQVAPKQCQAKYIIETDKSIYYPDDVVRITVRGATENDHFKGILLTAKNQPDQQIVGTWSTTNSPVKTIDCDSKQNTAITHMTADDKLRIEALWHAPNVLLQGDTIIKATIVKSYDEIYVDCFNITLVPKQKDLVDESGNERNSFVKANTNVSWTYTSDTVTVKMSTSQVNISQWRSIGFSDDREMGNEYIFVCQVSSAGAPSLRRMHTLGGKRPPSASVADVSVISATYENGQATCEFSFNTTSEQIANEPVPVVTRKNYYLIFGAGILRSGDSIAKHNFTFVSSKMYQLQNPEIIDIDILMANTTAPVTNLIKANISWTYNNDTTSINMRINNLKALQWFSIAFSRDIKMGEDHVFICRRLADDTISLQRYVNPGGHTRPVLHNGILDWGGIFTVSREKLENGVVDCDFTLSDFVPATNESNQLTFPALSQSTEYIPLIALGNLNGSNYLLKHTYRVALPQNVTLNQTEVTDFEQIITSTPGTGGSTTASPASEVEIYVSWTYNAGTTDVKMKIANLKAAQWMAFGFSSDMKMGEDHVFICQHPSDGKVSLQRYVNPDGYTRPQLPDATLNVGGVLNVGRERLDDGIVYCDFTLSNFANTTRQSRQLPFSPLSQTSTYYPLIAVGSIGSSGRLDKHSFRDAMSRSVMLNRAETITVNAQSNGPSSGALMKAHGIIMIFTWIVLVSTGILIARYFKRSWSNRKLCGKAIWFAVHRTIMTSVAILTLIAFILILVYKKGQWVSQANRREFAHSIIGMLVISFAIIQPFMALFRCNPDARYRFIFNYAHATVGFSAFILSIAAIFLAMFFEYFDFRTHKEWAIVAAWSCWLPIIFVAFEVIEVYFQKASLKTVKVDSYAMNERNGTNNAKVDTKSSADEPVKDRIKVIFLSLHLLIAFALALALMILIGQSPD